MLLLQVSLLPTSPEGKRFECKCAVRFLGNGLYAKFEKPSFPLPLSGSRDHASQFDHNVQQVMTCMLIWDSVVRPRIIEDCDSPRN